MVSATVISRDFDIPRATLYRLVKENRVPVVEVTKPWHQRRRYLFDREAVGEALRKPRPSAPAAR